MTTKPTTKSKKNVARPKSKKRINKTKIICIRVTPDAHKLIKKHAKQKKMNISQYIVSLLNVNT